MFKAMQTPFLSIARVTVNFLCVFVGVSYLSVPSQCSSLPSDAPRPEALVVFPFLLCICVRSQFVCWELDLPVPTSLLHHKLSFQALAKNRSSSPLCISCHFCLSLLLVIFGTLLFNSAEHLGTELEPRVYLCHGGCVKSLSDSMSFLLGRREGDIFIHSTTLLSAQ